MIREAIVLAGGFGTRLREAVPDLPKCMAPINGLPFIHYLLQQYISEGIEHFIMSLGYRADVIKEYCSTHFPQVDFTYMVEDEPLGTGGAIAWCCSSAKSEHVIVLNGDTFYTIDLASFSGFHQNSGAECTLALKPMKDFDRYGVVELDEKGMIRSFFEKRYYKEGLINGGIYAIHVPSFLKHSFPKRFSFEKDYLERFCNEGIIHGSVQDGYFIDIGIPSDYKKAQHELPLQIEK